jgi:hypothetical protein
LAREDFVADAEIPPGAGAEGKLGQARNAGDAELRVAAAFGDEVFEQRRVLPTRHLQAAESVSLGQVNARVKRPFGTV